MSALRDLLGKTFGFLTVVSRGPNTNCDRPAWHCRCHCGTTKIVPTASLVRKHGSTKSCGCKTSSFFRANMSRHGMSRTKEHRAWCAMLSRCRNPNCNAYPNYGARGITVCDSWQTAFENFYADMGPSPTSKHSLDRINVDGNYEPSNCRWATVHEQANNRRKGRHLFNGQTLSLAEIIRQSGTTRPYPTIHQRLYRYGWPINEALFAPPRH